MPHKSRDSKSQGELVKHWGLLTKGVAANAPDLPHLEGRRVELDGIVITLPGLLSQQKVQMAAKQDITREIESLMSRGFTLATFLRVGVKEHYGKESEKLVEFDLPPFRGTARPVRPPVIETKRPVETKGTEKIEEAKEVPAKEE